jgi:predicted RNA-binding protein with PUA domain
VAGVLRAPSALGRSVRHGGGRRTVTFTTPGETQFVVPPGMSSITASVVEAQ